MEFSRVFSNPPGYSQMLQSFIQYTNFSALFSSSRDLLLYSHREMGSGSVIVIIASTVNRGYPGTSARLVEDVSFLDILY